MYLFLLVRCPDLVIFIAQLVVIYQFVYYQFRSLLKFVQSRVNRRQGNKFMYENI